MTLLHGNNLDLLRAMPDNSVHSIVCDPPYGLGKEPDALAMLRDWIETGHHDVKSKSGFMGKTWDAFVPQPVQWRECLRVLKPGGHVLSFAGTRTHDLITMGLRIAGFEIRDQIDWIYGSGFPKSLDVGKALDKMAGAEREVVGFDEKKASQQTRAVGTAAYGDYAGNTGDITAPATEAAKQWDGWGTALKPALEPITLARKPLEGTVAANVLKWHTGALNVDGCRVESSMADKKQMDAKSSKNPTGKVASNVSFVPGICTPSNEKGRWPANLIHDGSDEVTGLFPMTTSGKLQPHHNAKESVNGSMSGKNYAGRIKSDFGGDSGSAARFFYAAKVSTKEREGSVHPTMKPIALMRYLCRLITPPGGTVLDPWMGSGSTGKAAALEGFGFIGMEQDAGYFAIAQARCGVTPDGAELDPYEL